MRKFILVVGLIVIGYFQVNAQEVPKVEIFAGYSQLQGAGPTYDGFNTSINYNVTKNIGIVADFGGLYGRSNRYAEVEIATFGSFKPVEEIRNGTINWPDHEFFKSSSNIHTFMVGPKFSCRRYKAVTPFVQGLVGVHRVAGDTVTYIYEPEFDVVQGKFSNTHLAASFGGGVDININKNIAVRAVQADYLFLQKVNGEKNENSARLSFGLVFKFSDK